jgi:hypothetical protein
LFECTSLLEGHFGLSQVTFHSAILFPSNKTRRVSKLRADFQLVGAGLQPRENEQSFSYATERIREQSNRLWKATCRLIAAGLEDRRETFFPTRRWQAVVYQPEENSHENCHWICLLVAFIGVAPPPASAQTSDYYVVQEVKTKKCTIVDKKPTTTTEYSILSDGTVFKSRTEAESGMKTYKVCTSN